MARIRSVHPGLFTDESFMTASIHARLLLIGLWTECWDDGVFDWKPLTLKARIFPVDSVDVSALLAELEALDIIKPFERGGKRFGAVRNFCRFQRPKKPNNSGVISDHIKIYVGISSTGSEPVPHQSETGGEKSPQMEDGEGVGGEEEEETEAAQPVSHVHVQAREAGELLGHLIDAAGLAEPLPPQLEDTGPIAELVAKGYSLRDRILPVIRSRRGKPFTTWGYFVKAIEEAEQRGAGIGKARQATPAAAVWIAEGSAEWAAATKARGKPPLVTYQSGLPGAWVRPEDVRGAAA